MLTSCLIIFALILVSKLYFIQVVSGEEFATRAEHQYIAGESYFDRGSIFFSSKEGDLIPAASVRSGFLLSINPTILKGTADLDGVYEKLSLITPLEKEEFMTKASRTDDPYEELATRLDQSTGDELRLLKIPGVSVVRERWRTYPGDEMAAHTVGLIGYSETGGDTLTGRYGLERYYEKTLGRGSGSVFVNFFAEIFADIRSAVEDGDELEGDLITTIEPSVEAFVESELKKVTEKYSSDWTGGIVMNPMNGEIVAMAMYPTFSPNSPERAESSGIFSNKLVEDRYEMGSIMKALTYAIGLESSAVSAKTTYNDPGCMTLNTKKFCNYDGKSHGSVVTMQEALNKSLNTGAAFVAARVGNKKFADYLSSFAIGDKTDIDLPNEGLSLISNLRTGRDLEIAQASFGQGIALTPIGTVRALSTLANGGTLIKPHLVREIRYKLGPSKTLDYKDAVEGKRVISEKTSAEITRMLVEVVDRSLKNGAVRLENYSVAAKTGTAQIASPEGGYYEDRFLHSFFGYFPAYDPEFLVFYFTYDPKDVQFASETLTDSFINTTKFLINYYEIPPDREQAPSAGVTL